MEIRKCNICGIEFESENELISCPPIHSEKLFILSPMTPLEQFNEEVKKKFDDYIEKSEIINLNFIKEFITQKLTEQKELILKMVRERVPKIKIIGENIS